jgi:hypothetical protein
VHRKSLLCSVKRTRGLNPSAKVVESGQKAWSNGKSALLVRVPAQLGLSLSVYLAEFLGFARLRPTRLRRHPPGARSCRPPWRSLCQRDRSQMRQRSASLAGHCGHGDRHRALSQSGLFEVKVENRILDNQCFASLNFSVFGHVRQSRVSPGRCGTRVRSFFRVQREVESSLPPLCYFILLRSWSSGDSSPRGAVSLGGASPLRASRPSGRS